MVGRTRYARAADRCDVGGRCNQRRTLGKQHSSALSPAAHCCQRRQRYSRHASHSGCDGHKEAGHAETQAVVAVSHADGSAGSG